MENKAELCGIDVVLGSKSESEFMLWVRIRMMFQITDLDGSPRLRATYINGSSKL